MITGAPKQVKDKDPILFCRADPELVADVQEIADREYEGVFSRVIRAAVRKFVAEKQAEQTQVAA